MPIIKFLGILILLTIASAIIPFGELITTAIYWYALWKLINEQI